jgi:hypothetical protein
MPGNNFRRILARLALVSVVLRHDGYAKVKFFARDVSTGMVVSIMIACVRVLEKICWPRGFNTKHEARLGEPAAVFKNVRSRKLDWSGPQTVLFEVNTTDEVVLAASDSIKPGYVNLIDAGTVTKQ